jgi:hypothetical protein
MHTVNVPILQVALRIYKSDERSKFEKVYGSMPDEWYGCQNGEAVFIGENPKQDKIGTCYHEATHWVDWVLEHRLSMEVEGLEGHTELRAYMVQYAGDQIRRYCCE